MKEIIFRGGFHNCGEISVRVSDADAESIQSKEAAPYEVLTDYQMKRLNRHFCGVKDCQCGGMYRASYTIK